MATSFVCRLIVVSPVAGGKFAGIATWLNANLAANTVPADLGPGLSASGAAPATYAWCNIALTAADAKAALSRLCTLATVTTPTAGQWDNASPAQRRTWWASVRNTVWTNYGVWCQLADNDGTWDDPVAVLTLRGLQTIAPASP
jgi:hypothetical protein